MDSKNIKDIFDQPSHISILSTVDPEGTPNSAIFGSTQLIADQVVVACGNNRTAKNLQHNRKAHLLVTIPGETILTFSGLRLQLSCVKIERSGPELEKIRADVRKNAGRTAARMIQQLLYFDIIEQRNLVEVQLSG